MCESCGCSGAETEKSFQEKVADVIEMVRPALQGHGGDVELVGVGDNNTVKVRLQGACQGVSRCGHDDEDGHRAYLEREGA